MGLKGRKGLKGHGAQTTWAEAAHHVLRLRAMQEGGTHSRPHIGPALDLPARIDFSPPPLPTVYMHGITYSMWQTPLHLWCRRILYAWNIGGTVTLVYALLIRESRRKDAIGLGKKQRRYGITPCSKLDLYLRKHGRGQWTRATTVPRITPA